MTLAQWIEKHPDKEIELSRNEWLLKGIPVEKEEYKKYLDYEIIEAHSKATLTMEDERFKIIYDEKIFEITVGKKKGYVYAENKARI